MNDLHDFMDFTRRHLNLDDHTANRFQQNFVDNFGGDRFYIPKQEAQLAPRNQEIRNAFNGRNYSELSKQYGLSDRQIRRIVDG